MSIVHPSCLGYLLEEVVVRSALFLSLEEGVLGVVPGLLVLLKDSLLGVVDCVREKAIEEPDLGKDVRKRNTFSVEENRRGLPGAKCTSEASVSRSRAFLTSPARRSLAATLRSRFVRSTSILYKLMNQAVRAYTDLLG